LILLCLSLAALAVAASASADTTQTFKAIFKEDYLKSGIAHPCSDNVSLGCFGGGEILGFGDATESFTFTDSSDEPPGRDDLRRHNDHARRRQRVVRQQRGLRALFPRQLAGGPGHLVSYGNPVLSTGTFEIVEGSGTGIFEGATGSCTVSFVFAGAALVVTYEGTITLC
jgi:hypothetical protein